MERFTQDIVAASCSEPMLIQFGHLESFVRARNAWRWVNQAVGNSFVLAADPLICKSGDSKDPWLVSGAIFDPATRTIHLEALKREWTDVIYDFKIDFGSIAAGVQKRFLDYNLPKSWEIPLAATFPKQLIDFAPPPSTQSYLHFGVNCINCALNGRLVFEGHIEGNVLTGPRKLDLLFAPRDIHADISLALLLAGSYEFTSIDGVNPMQKKIPRGHSASIFLDGTRGPHSWTNGISSCRVRAEVCQREC